MIAQRLVVHGAIGVASNSAVDITKQTVEAGGDISQVDFMQTASQAPKSFVGGIVGGAAGNQILRGLGAASAASAATGSSAAQISDDAILRGLQKATEAIGVFTGAKAAGAAAGGVVKAQIPEVKRNKGNQ